MKETLQPEDFFPFLYTRPLPFSCQVCSEQHTYTTHTQYGRLLLVFFPLVKASPRSFHTGQANGTSHLEAASKISIRLELNLSWIGRSSFLWGHIHMLFTTDSLFNGSISSTNTYRFQFHFCFQFGYSSFNLKNERRFSCRKFPIPR